MLEKVGEHKPLGYLFQVRGETSCLEQRVRRVDNELGRFVEHEVVLGKMDPPTSASQLRKTFLYAPVTKRRSGAGLPENQHRVASP